jgi:hypothetical protein
MDRKKTLLIAALLAATLAVGAAGVHVIRLITPQPPRLAAGGRAQGPDLAHPARFDTATAMLAVHGAYDAQRPGTLLPAGLTAGWQLAQATALATPMLALTYDEDGQRLAVLVEQRQQVQQGEVAFAHAEGATVAVHVFRFDGKVWSLARTNADVITTGAHGQAPPVRLVQTGDQRHGLLFEGSDVHQGYTNGYAFLVGLSEPAIELMFSTETEESNGGACSDDAQERQESDGLIKPCWGHEARIDFLRHAGAAYYSLRLTDSGTLQDDRDGDIHPVLAVTLHVVQDGKYQPATDPRLLDDPVVPAVPAVPAKAQATTTAASRPARPASGAASHAD